MELQREGDRIPEEVYEYSKADNEYRNLRRQPVRSLRTLVAISAHLLRSYDFHSSSTESSQFVLGVANYVNGLQEELAIMQLEVEDVRATQLPTASKLVDNESAALGTDYTFALRHFLCDAIPSMQLSPLCDSNSIAESTLYRTKLTHIDVATALALTHVGSGPEVAPLVKSSFIKVTFMVSQALCPSISKSNWTALSKTSRELWEGC